MVFKQSRYTFHPNDKEKSNIYSNSLKCIIWDDTVTPE